MVRGGESGRPYPEVMSTALRLLLECVVLVVGLGNTSLSVVDRKAKASALFYAGSLSRSVHAVITRDLVDQVKPWG